jgi:hypothetical protein
VVNRGAVCISGKTIVFLASNSKLRDKHVHCVHLQKMEDKCLTADRYSLHFEVCTRDPIGVGERNGRATVSPIFKSLRLAPKAFVFLKPITIS